MDYGSLGSTFDESDDALAKFLAHALCIRGASLERIAASMFMR